MPVIEEKKEQSPLDEIYKQVTGKAFDPKANAEKYTDYKPGMLLDEILQELSPQEVQDSSNLKLPISDNIAADSFFMWLFGRFLIERVAVNTLLNYFKEQLDQGIRKEIPAYIQDFRRFESGEQIDSSEPYPGQGYVDSMNKKFDSEITPRLKSVALWLKDLLRRDSERAGNQLWHKN